MRTVGWTIVVLGMWSALGTSRECHDQQNYLWVMDNSGSMRPRRSEVVAAFKEFTAELAKYGVTKYKMGITTTDVFWHPGKLMEFEERKIVSQDSNNPEKEFGAIVDAIEDTPTSFWEQGLENSFLALEGEGKVLIEKGVPLNVIYISDENDYSCKDNCFGVEPENNKDWVPHVLERYTTFFATLKSQLGVPIHIYSIVGTDDSLCTVASLGERYEALQREFRGFTASVCASVVKKNVLRVAEDSAARR